MSEKPLTIAVIGGGVAGIVSAHILSRAHRVWLFEKNDYLGGHTNTVSIPHGEDAGLAVDTGFIVLNDKTYPLFHKFLAQLEVPVRWSDMSFGYHNTRSGLCYSGRGLRGLFAQKKNLFIPAYYRFLGDIKKFCASAASDLETGTLAGLRLKDYVDRLQLGDAFLRDYLLPMGASIWSTPALGMEDFPAETLVRFFKNHGLLSLCDRPRWQTVVGGSQEYVKAFRRAFTGEVVLRSGSMRLERDEAGVTMVNQVVGLKRFDAVVLAVHADQACGLLADASQEERRLLGAWKYEPNQCVLHTDAAIMPPARGAWASWNYRRSAGLGESEDSLIATYDMSRLQGLRSKKNYFVTLNAQSAIRPETVIKVIDYHHPLYDLAALNSQKELASLQGQQHTWFCGSYFGYGFHEDAVRSAVLVGRSFGLEL